MQIRSGQSTSLGVSIVQAIEGSGIKLRSQPRFHSSILSSPLSFVPPLTLFTVVVVVLDEWIYHSKVGRPACSVLRQQLEPEFWFKDDTYRSSGSGFLAIFIVLVDQLLHLGLCTRPLAPERVGGGTALIGVQSLQCSQSVLSSKELIVILTR